MDCPSEECFQRRRISGCARSYAQAADHAHGIPYRPRSAATCETGS
jgi:hypothetical protein